jgi:electron transport complex protein RnfG
MAKMKSTLPNMVLVLFVITLVSGFSLGAVYEVTKNPIALANQKKTIEAIKSVCPQFDNEPSKEKFEKEYKKEKEKVVIYTAKMADQTVGYAIETFSMKAFNGKIKLMVGVTNELKINKVAVLYQAETPGLGTKMAEPKFLKQFDNQDLNQFKLSVAKDGGQVDAITAATISSRAFCDAVARAKQDLEQYINN